MQPRIPAAHPQKSCQYLPSVKSSWKPEGKSSQPSQVSGTQNKMERDRVNTERQMENNYNV